MARAAARKLALAMFCLAASVAPAAADVFVLANRARQPIRFKLSADGRSFEPRPLASGAATSFPWQGPTKLSFAEKAGEREVPVAANSVYFFYEDPASGALTLKEIGLTDATEILRQLPRRAAVAAPPPDSDEAKKAPATNSLPPKRPYRIAVKLLVDEEERAARPLWEARLRKRLADASRVFEEHFGLGFEATAVDSWRSSNRLTEFDQSLSEFEQQVSPAPAEIAIGFTSQYQLPEGRTDLAGTRGPLRPHILIREWSQHVSEPERLELLIHELGHYLGAVHSPENDSVMRPLLADRQALARSFRIGFDPLNTLAMALVAEERSRRKLESLSELSPQARKRLEDVYLTLLEAMPEDPAAAQFFALASGRTFPLVDEMGEMSDEGEPALVAENPKDARDSASQRGEKKTNTSTNESKPASGKTPLVEATQAVIEAIEKVARKTGGKAKATKKTARSDSDGDELAAAYIRAAASAAAQQSKQTRIKAFCFGLAIALDRDDSLRKYAVMSDLIREIDPDKKRDARTKVLGAPTMNGRRDLLQHFLLSAAITVSAGATSAEAVGLAKEVHDAEFGSGFSFVDWCADLAGISLAKRLQSGELSLAAVARGFRTTDFLPEVDGLPEGLPLREFRKQFGSTSDRRFKLYDDDARRRIKQLIQASEDTSDR